MGGGGCGKCHDIYTTISNLCPSYYCGKGGGCGHSVSRVDENAEHLKKIAKELEDAKAPAIKSSEKAENAIIESINSSMDSFIDELEISNHQNYAGLQLDLNIASLKKRKNELNNSIRGHIRNEIEKRLILEDNELKTILDERDDKKRNKNFDNFRIRIMNKAIDSLKSVIERTINTQQKEVENAVNFRLKEVEKNSQKTLAEYEKLAVQSEADSSEKKKLQLQYMYEEELLEIIDAELSEAENLAKISDQ